MATSSTLIGLDLGANPKKEHMIGTVNLTENIWLFSSILFILLAGHGIEVPCKFMSTY